MAATRPRAVIAHNFICACCRATSPDGRTPEEGRRRSVLAGWLIGARSSLCPDCRLKVIAQPAADRGAA